MVLITVMGQLDSDIDKCNVGEFMVVSNTISTRRDVAALFYDKIGKVGLMHDRTMSRDLRDIRRVSTKNLMAIAKRHILGPY